MNDERISKILDWLADRITKAESFVLEQAPDIVQQIVSMDCATAWLTVAAMVFLIFLGICAYGVFWFCSRSMPDRGFARAMAAMFLMLLGIPAIELGANLKTAIKCHVAPKAYLLERVGVLKHQ